MWMDACGSSEKLKTSDKIGEISISIADADAGSEDRIRAFEDLIFKGALSFVMQNQNRQKQFQQ